jgi:hypothetical protein
VKGVRGLPSHTDCGESEVAQWLRLLRPPIIWTTIIARWLDDWISCGFQVVGCGSWGNDLVWGCLRPKDHPKGATCCNQQVLHLAQGHMCETSVLHGAIGFAAAVRKAAAFGFRRFEGDYPRMGPCAQNKRKMWMLVTHSNHQLHL